MSSSHSLTKGASRLEIRPGVWLDHRRAIFLAEESILAVADLHLGFNWAHRYHGQMLPLGPADDLLGRLQALCSDYRPTRLAILGDIVHQAVPVAEITSELNTLFHELGKICGLKLILGNHDKKLKKIAKDTSLEFLTQFETENFLLTHGDNLSAVPPGKCVVMGHEHPAISLGDGIKSATFPCFVLGGDSKPLCDPSAASLHFQGLLILPAFSQWSAGSDIRAYPFMSSVARRARLQMAIAICGTKLLPVKLG